MLSEDPWALVANEGDGADDPLCQGCLRPCGRVGHAMLAHHLRCPPHTATEPLGVPCLRCFALRYCSHTCREADSQRSHHVECGRAEFSKVSACAHRSEAGLLISAAAARPRS